MGSIEPPEFDFDVQSLGFLAIDWIEQHVVHPDHGVRQVDFTLYRWQAFCTIKHYEIVPGATVAMGSTAFRFSQSLIITPQKTGKGPWSATITAFEALGPCVFIGFAVDGDVFRCSDYGCDCGWSYAYATGEPMGAPRPRALIQLLAYNEDQVGNVYRPLKGMLQYGRFEAAELNVSVDFIRTPGDGLIQVVTSKAKGRLGAPLHFAVLDEPQLFTDENGLVETADTVLRGLAGMDGRSLLTTNPWDSGVTSMAQRVWEDTESEDVFKFWQQAPEDLDYLIKAERQQIHEYVYAGSEHVNLAAIERLALKLIRRGDPGQAERFFGGRVVAGARQWLPPEAWKARADPREVPLGTQIVLGFDGSDIDDWTGIRAETQDGYQFTPVAPSGPTIWNPADYDGQVPRLEVTEAVDWLFANFDVVLMHADPPYWETEVDSWAAKHGEKRVVRWATYRPSYMHAAAERMVTDVTKADSDFTHDACGHTTDHINATRTKQKPGARWYTLTKPGDGRKIDLSICSILAHEAAGDVTATKRWRRSYQSYSE